MGFFREPCQLLGAPAMGGVGEVGFLVPADDGSGAGDQGLFAGESAEEIERGVHAAEFASLAEWLQWRMRGSVAGHGGLPRWRWRGDWWRS